MSDGTFRGRWVSVVLRSALITDAVRVALLALAMDMDDAGRVSVPRDELVDRLGRNRRKVDARIKAAIEAGFLQRVTRGQKGQTAVYQAIAPNISAPPGGHAEHADFSAPPRGHAEGVQHAGFKHPETDSQHAGFKHPEESQHVPRGAHRDSFSMSPGGRTTYKGNADVSDNGEGVVIALFDDEEKEPPPAGADAPPVERRQSPTQHVVAAYIEGVKEATGERPDRRRIGHISKQAKTLLDEDDRDLKRLAEAALSLGRKVGKGYTDLGHEYLIVAAASRQPATGTDGHRPYRNPDNPDVYDEDLKR